MVAVVCSPLKPGAPQTSDTTYTKILITRLRAPGRRQPEPPPTQGYLRGGQLRLPGDGPVEVRQARPPAQHERRLGLLPPAHQPRRGGGRAIVKKEKHGRKSTKERTTRERLSLSCSFPFFRLILLLRASRSLFSTVPPSLYYAITQHALHTAHCPCPVIHDSLFSSLLLSSLPFMSSFAQPPSPATAVAPSLPSNTLPFLSFPCCVPRRACRAAFCSGSPTRSARSSNPSRAQACK